MAGAAADRSCDDLGRIRLPRLAGGGGVDLFHRHPGFDEAALALGPVGRERRELDPVLGAGGRGPFGQTLDRLWGRVLDPALEVEELAVQAPADRAPEVLLDHAAGDVEVRQALGL